MRFQREDRVLLWIGGALAIIVALLLATSRSEAQELPADTALSVTEFATGSTIPIYRVGTVLILGLRELPQGEWIQAWVGVEQCTGMEMEPYDMRVFTTLGMQDEATGLWYDGIYWSDPVEIVLSLSGQNDESMLETFVHELYHHFKPELDDEAIDAAALDCLYGGN
jgi:hypothetical protein